MTDFDGVIVESNKAKTEAFRKCFSIYPEYLEEIVAYHKANLGLTRYQKFEHIFRSILKLDYSDVRERWITERFHTIVWQELDTCQEVPGVRSFLETFSKVIPIVVISAAPLNELTRMIDQRHLRTYLQEVMSVKSSKSVIIGQLLQKYSITSNKAVYIGDTNSDLVAAKENHVPFLGRKDQEKFRGPRIGEISDFSAIGQYLQLDSNGEVRLRLQTAEGELQQGCL